MIERGSGRTSGLTDWRLMDVLSMWACLQDHDTTGHWQQVAGWRKVCDLAQTHLSRLQEYRRGLAEAWPPETNTAARAYIDELDQLIEKVQRTHDAAAANHDALAAATRAIGSTRTELKPIYDEYAARLQQKQAYEATVADPKAVAGSRLPEQPPVTDADLERLNVHARGLMTGLSGELQQAQVMLRQPPTPGRLPTKDPSNPDVYGGTTAAPTIPPIVPVPVTISRSAPSVTKAPTATRPAPMPTAPAVGPVLGGIGAAPAPAALTPGPLGATPTPSSPTLSPGVGLPPTVPPVPGSPARTRGAGPLRGRPDWASRPVSDGKNGVPHATPPRPLPPGGLIGGPPGMGLGQPSGATQPRRVNPIGGLIGGGGAGTAPSGAAGSRPGTGRTLKPGYTPGMSPPDGAFGVGNTSGLSGASGRPIHREPGDGDSLRWDPDHPWETDEGVNPVLRPPGEKGPIDPGPAIGFEQ